MLSQPNLPQLDQAKMANQALEFDMTKFIYISVRTIPWVVFIFILTFIGVFIFLRYTKNVYEATSTIQLQFKSSRSLLNMEAEIFAEGIDAVNMSSEISLIKSKLIYRQIIDSINLRISYFREGEVLSDELYPKSPFRVEVGDNFGYLDKPIYVDIVNDERFSIYKKRSETGQLFRFGEEFEFLGSKMRINKTPTFDKDAPGKYSFIYNSDQAIFANFDQNLIVEVSNESSQALVIKFRGFNRYKCIDIVSQINKIYLEETIKNKNVAFEQNLAYLNKQLNAALDSIEKVEKELERYKKIEKELARGKTINDNPIIAKIEKLQEDKFEIKSRFKDLLKIDTLLKNESDSTIFIVKYLLNNLQATDLTKILLQYEEAKKAFERVEGGYNQESYVYKERYFLMKKSINELLNLLALHKLMILEKLRVLDEKLYSLQSQLVETEELDDNYKKLKRYLEVYEKNYNLLQTKLIEIGLIKSGTVANHRVLALPYASQQPIYPVVYLVYLIAILMAVFISFFVIVIRYFLHDTIDAVREIEKHTNIPVLGIIPKYTKKEMEFSRPVVHLNPKSSISESLRAIRTNLDFFTSKEGERKIAVTSTVSGEGKTFVAVNLAAIIAMSGKRVIMVDLDMRKPKIHRAFNVDNGNGLSSLLAKKTSLDQIIRASDIENLDFITSGPLPPNPSELILSEQFSAVETELERRYDFVVFDTPPVGLVTDGTIILKRVGKPIYVVRARYSKIGYLKVMNKIAETNSITNLSVVLNAVPVVGGYGYGYGYGYGGYGGYSMYGYGGYYGRSGYYDEDTKIKKNKKAKV